MRRVLPPDEFRQWLAVFLPKLPLAPVEVVDRSDPQLVHLDGLNLSRAWCLFDLAPHSNREAEFIRVGRVHYEAGRSSVSSGHYEGEHWLASFAVLAALSGAVEPQG